MFPLTVAVLTRNRIDYLRDCLNAILSQTYADFELLVLDNASTDGTANYVLSIDDHRLRYIRNPAGQDVHFNAMSAKWISRGERIIVTHDDDIMHPDMLLRMMNFIRENPRLDVVWCNHSVIDKFGNVIVNNSNSFDSDRIYKPGEYIAQTALDPVWVPPSAMIFSHRKLSQYSLSKSYLGLNVKRAGNIPKGVNRDFILPAELNIKGEVGYISDTLFYYRQHGSQLTNSVDLVAGALKTHQVLRRFLKKTEYYNSHEPIISARILRCQFQDFIINYTKQKIDRVFLRKLKTFLSQAVSCLNRSNDDGNVVKILSPIFIVSLQLKVLDCEYADKVVSLKWNIKSKADLSFLQWIKCLKEGVSKFSFLSEVDGGLVQIGTSLVSAMILIELKIAGIRVDMCADSNVGRQGKELLGARISSFKNLNESNKKISLLTTSERDHESKILSQISNETVYDKEFNWKKIVLG